MSDRMLQFENVGVAFRRRLNPFSKKQLILKDLSFDLYRGETLGVIGRNGAGKSTLLKLLADIIHPDTGKIWRAKGLRSQLLSLNLGFNKNLSGYDNTVMALVTQGMRISQAKSLVSEIAEFGEIPHLMEQPVGTYSAGERARLGFSIAIRTNPDILLLDEILGVGDKQFKERSSKELKKRVNSEQTVVLVSHSIRTLRNLCDRVMWIENGRAKILGPTKEVLDSYSQEAELA
ncbi:ABC transporter ATP-binding protein [Microbulbifer aggregans]|uniref:ABC transporter ATP-binding protein n=1 Tax=Microbulbifer aggregans TaxID=1769779 RepID=UPI001CFDE9BA|nr:ATP-binding cassette domain-containing protein [Microbulbifer aggregans]